MPKLKRGIEVRLLKDAEDYFVAQNHKVQEKFLKIFDKTEMGFKGDWYEKPVVMESLNLDVETIKSFTAFSPFGIQKMKQP